MGDSQVESSSWGENDHEGVTELAKNPKAALVPSSFSDLALRGRSANLNTKGM